jgi:hypothetical protein
MARSFTNLSYASCETIGSFNLWPKTFSFWIRPHDTGTTAIPVSFSKDNLQYSYFRIGSAGSSRFYQRNTAPTYASVANPPQDEWSFVVCRAASETDTRLWINGVTGSDSTNKGSGGSYTPYAVIGGTYNGSYSSDFDGDIAHVALWDIDITDAEVTALYNGGIGIDPRAISPGNLVSYWPLIDHDNDIVSNYHLTPYNSPSFVPDAQSGIYLPEYRQPARVFWLEQAVVSGVAETSAVSTLPTFGQQALVQTDRQITAVSTLPTFGQLATVETQRQAAAISTLPSVGQQSTTQVIVQASALGTLPSLGIKAEAVVIGGAVNSGLHAIEQGQVFGGVLSGLHPIEQGIAL